VLTGIPAATLEQVRETLEAQVSLEFLSWTKLTMALATGSQHMNLLAPASGARGGGGWRTGGDGGDGAKRIDGYVCCAGFGDAAKFSAGSIIALDADYTGQTDLWARRSRERMCGRR
jgi:hypothetical protein